MPCIQYIVSGRVQGVFFRVSTRDHAQSLDLTGQVRNLPDGRVAVTACGSRAALDSLQQWLWQGPPQAVVNEVQCERCAENGFEGFSIA